MYSQYENLNILVWEKRNGAEQWEVLSFLHGPLLNCNYNLTKGRAGSSDLSEHVFWLFHTNWKLSTLYKALQSIFQHTNCGWQENWAIEEREPFAVVCWRQLTSWMRVSKMPGWLMSKWGDWPWPPSFSWPDSNIIFSFKLLWSKMQ